MEKQGQGLGCLLETSRCNFFEVPKEIVRSELRSASTAPRNHSNSLQTPSGYFACRVST
jgi:hypothetical protein